MFKEEPTKQKLHSNFISTCRPISYYGLMISIYTPFLTPPPPIWSFLNLAMCLENEMHLAPLRILRYQRDPDTIFFFFFFFFLVQVYGDFFFCVAQNPLQLG